MRRAADALPSRRPRDLFAKFDPLIAAAPGPARHRREGSVRAGHGKVKSPTVAICNGKETILLGTYNYMGMTFDPDVIAAGKKALDEFGSGTTGSRVLNGTYAGHKAVRAGAEGLLRHGPRDGLLDRLPGQSRHHLDASPARAITSSSTSTATPRSTTAARWAMPRSCRSATTTSPRSKSASRRIPAGAGKLVVLEGVYSMLGDIAPLKEMVAVAKAAGAMVLVDEAHSMGFIGDQRPRRRRGAGRARRGRFRHRHLLQERRHGRRLLRLQPSQVRDPAPGLPPLRLHRLAAAARRRHRRDLDPQADARRRQARASVGEFASASTRGLKALGFTLGTETPQSAIIAVIMPDLEKGAAMWEALLDEGLYVNLARPPATPANMTLLRCSLCAEHSDRAGRPDPRACSNAAGRATNCIRLRRFRELSAVPSRRS